MDRKLRVLFWFCSSYSIPDSRASRRTFTPPSAIWRDAPQSEAESELDLVSRAYVRLANDGASSRRPDPCRPAERPEERH